MNNISPHDLAKIALRTLCLYFFIKILIDLSGLILIFNDPSLFPSTYYLNYAFVILIYILSIIILWSYSDQIAEKIIGNSIEEPSSSPQVQLKTLLELGIIVTGVFIFITTLPSVFGLLMQSFSSETLVNESVNKIVLFQYIFKLVLGVILVFSAGNIVKFIFNFRRKNNE